MMDAVTNRNFAACRVELRREQKTSKKWRANCPQDHMALVFLYMVDTGRAKRTLRRSCMPSGILQQMHFATRMYKCSLIVTGMFVLQARAHFDDLGSKLEG